MPIYRYRCPVPQCAAEVERIFKIADPAPPCPRCAPAAPMVKVPAASAFKLNGIGVYSTRTY